MTLSKEDKKTLSRIRIEKARKFLEDARATFNEGRYETSVNRSYYAALNAGRSLLILEGVDPSSHKGVITMLGLKFVRTNLLPKEFIKHFELLLARRTDVDYGDLELVDKEDAFDSLGLAEGLVEKVDALREKIIGGL
ncbi:MAG: HEPN domain-containing protein [Nitrospirae bacterium]|nr:MAG: HEPN domain-containing protein [Nitrospirota bacterium]